LNKIDNFRVSTPQKDKSERNKSKVIDHNLKKGHPKRILKRKDKTN